jgi:hypothetical protein
MFSKLSKYGPVNSIDAWRFFAIITMIIDHVGLLFFPENLYFRVVGRLSAPIWFYLAGRHFDSKISLKLAFYAVLLVPIVYYFYNQTILVNVLFSLIIAKLFVRLAHKINLPQKAHYSAILFLGFSFMFISMPAFEYGSVGLLFAYAGYLARTNKLGSVFLFSCSAIYLFSQQTIFDAESVEFIITGLCLIPLTLMLHKFRQLLVNAPKILLISRLSLDIYFWHLSILLIAAYLIKNPAQ